MAKKTPAKSKRTKLDPNARPIAKAAKPKPRQFAELRSTMCFNREEQIGRIFNTLRMIDSDTDLACLASAIGLLEHLNPECQDDEYEFNRGDLPTSDKFERGQAMSKIISVCARLRDGELESVYDYFDLLDGMLSDNEPWFMAESIGLTMRPEETASYAGPRRNLGRLLKVCDIINRWEGSRDCPNEIVTRKRVLNLVTGMSRAEYEAVYRFVRIVFKETINADLDGTGFYDPKHGARPHDPEHDRDDITSAEVKIKAADAKAR